MNPLDVVFESESGAITVRELIVRLGLEAFIHDESFSGKRPFGNSGWKWAPLDAIAEAADLQDGEVLAIDVSVRDAVEAWLEDLSATPMVTQ